MKRKSSGNKEKATGKKHHSASRQLKGKQAHEGIYQSVAEILRAARANAYRAINFTMVEAHWNLGRKIVEEEQKGLERAG